MGHHRRACRAAVALEERNAKLILKGLNDAPRQLSRARQYKLHAAEIFRRATANISLQKSRRGHHEGDGIFLRQRADDARIQRIRMEDNPCSQNDRQANCDREAEGVEEGKYAEDAVVLIQSKN